jgi:integrase
MRGHVRKRGTTWAVVVDVGRDPDTGKRRQRWTSGYKRRRDAEKALSELLSRLDGGVYVEPSKVTMADYLTARWLPAMRTQVRPSTWASYAGHVRTYLIPRLGHVPVQRVTADQLTALYGDLLAGGGRDGGALAARTVRYIAQTVRRALRDAEDAGLVPRNVAEKARPPKADTRNRETMRTWTPQQLRAFLASRGDDRLYGLWALLASTGLRRGEALGLAWEHVDLEAGRLAVRRALVCVGYQVQISEPKTTKSRRSVALDPGTVDALRAHRKAQLAERIALGPAWQDTGLVFTREDGALIHPDRASKLFERHLAAVDGLPRIRLHDLRHTHATLCLAAGIHPKVVSERLGHATVSMTLDTYSHAIPAMQEDAAAKVAALVLDAGT